MIRLGWVDGDKMAFKSGLNCTRNDVHFVLKKVYNLFWGLYIYICIFYIAKNIWI